MKMELIEIGLAGIFVIVILIVLYLTVFKKKKPAKDISPMGISQIVEEEINKRGEN